MKPKRKSYIDTIAVNAAAAAAQQRPVGTSVPSILSLIEIGGAAATLDVVAHGALPHIGGARLTPGQLSFATLAMCDVGLGGSDDERRRRSTGRWFRQMAHSRACTRLLLCPEECGFARSS